MENINETPATSIFAPIDISSSSEVNTDEGSELSTMFTHLVWDRWDFPEVSLIHVSEGLEGVDKSGNPAVRFHAVWQENSILFGAWFFRHTDEDDAENLYPVSITTMTKKTRMIQEDVYSRDNLSLPIAWVTYHNAI